MQYEFLKNFPRRMKNIGLYAVIVQNSVQKLSWKQYGFTKFDEQINLLFIVLLYIMEQSLKEEKCTMDAIVTLSCCKTLSASSQIFSIFSNGVL